MTAESIAAWRWRRSHHCLDDARPHIIFDQAQDAIYIGDEFGRALDRELARPRDLDLDAFLQPSRPPRAAAARHGVAARSAVLRAVAHSGWGPVNLFLYSHARARPAAAAATAVADSFLRLANCGSGWSRGWTSRRRGERPRPMGSPLDRRAVAHRGWGPVNLFVLPNARARPAAAGCAGDRGRRFLFAFGEFPDPAGAGDGPRAAGASGRDLWGLGAIAGLLRTAAGAPVNLFSLLLRAREARRRWLRRRARSPISFCVWRIPDPAGAGDGPRAAGASGRRGERPRRRPTPAATYGVAARSPGCCAQRLGVSGVLSIR